MERENLRNKLATLGGIQRVTKMSSKEFKVPASRTSKDEKLHWSPFNFVGFDTARRVACNVN
jgi:hypothetical protein